MRRVVTSRTQRVGVVGLGNMGLPMSGHLASAGFEVHGFDVLRDRLTELEGRGGEAHASPAAVAEVSDVVITALPSEAALDQVVFGVDGLLAGARAGLVVAETSTFSIAAKERCRDALGERSVALLDCPLSGTASQMRTGDIVVYASGDERAIDSCEAVFAAFSRSIYRAGAFGNGMRLKFIANHLVTVHTAAAAEALHLARRAGLDLDLTLRAISDGAGTSRMLEVRGPLMVAERFGDPNMALVNYWKDVMLISSFGREARAPMLLFSLAAQLCVAARGQGRDGEDPAAMYAVLEDMAGTERPTDAVRA